MEEYSKLSDEELVEKIKEELKVSHSKDPILDANAKVNAMFEVIYKRYQLPIRRHIGKLIFDKEFIDDIFHEVIIKVYTNMSKFTVKTSFKAWVYRIATNVSINYIKRHKYKEKLLLNVPIMKDEDDKKELLDMMSDKNSNVEDKVAFDEIMRSVAKVVMGLPKDLREVFVLKKNESLTYDEIAEIVGCSSRHIKTKMAKALHIISDELKKKNITKDIIDF